VKTLLARLQTNLEAEIEVQTGIQNLLDQQLDILLQGKTDRLAAVLANAEEGIKQSRVLEDARHGLLSEIAQALAVPVKQLTLKMVEERVGQDAAELLGKGEELKALLAQIRDSNRKVGLLLRHSVLFIEDLVRVLTGGAVGAPTYTRAGEMKTRTTGALVAEA
jgi:flagellar biosynthesis/type III secretory pathway chaperone